MSRVTSRFSPPVYGGNLRWCTQMQCSPLPSPCPSGQQGSKQTALRRGYFAQSSRFSPGARSNSLVLFVTRIAPTAMACPAIAVSLGPIGVLAVRSATLMSPVAGQDSIEAGAERINQLDVAWGILRASGAKAHLGVGDDRRRDPVIRCTACPRRFSTASGCSRMMLPMQMTGMWICSVYPYFLHFLRKIRKK